MKRNVNVNLGVQVGYDNPGDLDPLPETADVVLGGFPCQDFSNAGKRLGFTNENGRGLLYKSMVEVVKRTKPLVFVAENVKGLLTMDKGNAVKAILRDFKRIGYSVSMNLYLAAEHGVNAGEKMHRRAGVKMHQG